MMMVMVMVVMMMAMAVMMMAMAMATMMTIVVNHLPQVLPFRKLSTPFQQHQHPRLVISSNERRLSVLLQIVYKPIMVLLRIWLLLCLVVMFSRMLCIRDLLLGRGM
jgi:hypothetical protein